MGLLLMGHDPKFQRLTNEIFTRQLRADTRLQEELDGRARQKMYQDVQYNVDFLYTALELEDEGILCLIVPGNGSGISWWTIMS